MMFQVAGEVDVSALQPLADIIGPVVQEVQVLVGGIFGIYLILVLVRIYFEHRKLRVMYQIRDHLHCLNVHFGSDEVCERRGFWKGLGNALGRKISEENTKLTSKLIAKKRKRSRKKK